MKLIRQNFNDRYTEGILESPYIAIPIFTLELPWKPSKTQLGGQNDISCIPNGEYVLHAHHRPNGDRVILLENRALGVFKYEEHLPAHGGRFLIEAHIANYIRELLGCIAPGRSRTPGRVWRSAEAMERVMHAFDAGDNTMHVQSMDTKEIFYPHKCVA